MLSLIMWSLRRCRFEGIDPSAEGKQGAASHRGPV
jgi:hypothetical protein